MAACRRCAGEGRATPATEEASRPYALLRSAMEDGEMVAIGTVVIRRKQYLAAIRPIEGALAMSTMRFADEVVPSSAIDGIPGPRVKPKPKELALAREIIDALATGWKPESYHDTYTEELRRLIRKRSKGGETEVAEEEPADESAEVLDLMAALEKSVKGARKGRRGARTGGRKRQTRRSA